MCMSQASTNMLLQCIQNGAYDSVFLHMRHICMEILYLAVPSGEKWILNLFYNILKVLRITQKL